MTTKYRYNPFINNLDEVGTGADGTGITTINGDVGFVTGTTVGITGLTTAGHSVKFQGNNATAMTFYLSDADDNIFLGRLSAGGVSPITGINNVGLGCLNFTALTSGSYNVAIGTGISDISTGSNNVLVGQAAGAAISTGSSNTCVGYNAGNNLETGSRNILVGYQAGTNYDVAESSNIAIGNSGTIGESNVIRIGTQGSGAGQQDECYVAGIVGVSPSNAQTVTIDSTSGQLGVSTVPILQTTGPITLTNSQIKQLRTSPFVLVAAPAAGSMIAPVHLTYRFNYGGNNVFVTGGALQVRATGTSGLLLNATSDTLYTGSVDKFYATGATAASALNTIEGQPIVITTASSDPSGNAANDNTITVQFFYFVLTL